MPKLTGPDLKALREGLLLSAQAFADRLKHAELVPVGHVRTVQRWEEGARPVPDDIADYILDLERQVERMNQAAWNTLFLKDSLGGSLVAMIRYEDDAHMLDTKAPHDHRLHAAALQRLRSTLLKDGEKGLHLVRFDPSAFQAWCRSHSLRDDQPTRSRWAEEQVAAILGGMPTAPVEPLPERAGEGPRRIPHPRQKSE